MVYTRSIKVRAETGLTELPQFSATDSALVKVGLCIQRTGVRSAKRFRQLRKVMGRVGWLFGRHAGGLVFVVFMGLLLATVWSPKFGGPELTGRWAQRVVIWAMGLGWASSLGGPLLVAPSLALAEHPVFRPVGLLWRLRMSLQSFWPFGLILGGVLLSTVSQFVELGVLIAIAGWLNFAGPSARGEAGLMIAIVLFALEFPIPTNRVAVAAAAVPILLAVLLFAWLFATATARFVALVVQGAGGDPSELLVPLRRLVFLLQPVIVAVLGLRLLDDVVASTRGMVVGASLAAAVSVMTNLIRSGLPPVDSGAAPANQTAGSGL